MSARSNPPQGRRRIAAVLAVVVLASVACSDDLGLDEWEQGWRDTNAAIPALDAITSAEDPTPICSATVGMLREATAAYTDAPNTDLGEAFLEWAEYAESVFFECPPHDETGPGFERAYEEIHRLGVEVDALLSFERSLQGD
ncbi:MAG: hypothetical protein KQH83_05880 [Actinobacteria bacterium]|jgi:hypothetical protein|nr:hypothetical protein [Actinomycetota bacterium]